MASKSEAEADAATETLTSASTGAPEQPRPLIIGADAGPQPPFPLRMAGTVEKGFGRGSKELGIPTANIPVSSASWIDAATSGVYFGWCSIHFPPEHSALALATSAALPTEYDLPYTALAAGWRLYPMVMSIGYNPFYGNAARTAEVHVLQRFEMPFYGCEMRVEVLAFVRPERDYNGVEALVQDIKVDCDVARASLERTAWKVGGRGDEREGEREWLGGAN